MNKSWIATAALFAAAAVPACVQATDADHFDLVPRSEYIELIREAPLAYGNKHYAEAFAKYQRLACAGDKAGQAALGGMYLKGQGVARDDLAGYTWLKVASEYDAPSFRVIVKAIEEHLTPAQLNYAGGKAENLRALYGLRATNMSCTEGSTSSYASNLKDTVVCMPSVQAGQFALHQCVETK
jgi:TPR repeat protein